VAHGGLLNGDAKPTSAAAAATAVIPESCKDTGSDVLLHGVQEKDATVWVS